jgi:hypothetical protein
MTQDNLLMLLAAAVTALAGMACANLAADVFQLECASIATRRRCAARGRLARLPREHRLRPTSGHRPCLPAAHETSKFALEPAYTLRPAFQQAMARELTRATLA